MDNVIALAPRARARERTSDTADVLSVVETARRLGLSVNTTYVYLAAGTIPGRKVGRRWIVPRARLETWLASEPEESD